MSTEAIFNLDEALDRVDRDLDLFRTLVELLLEQGPKDLAEIQAALASGDPLALSRTAHRLKGAIAHFSSPALYESINDLESLGRRGTLEHAPTVYARVETGVQRLLDALRDVLAKGVQA